MLLVDDLEDDRFLFRSCWEQVGVPQQLHEVDGGQAALDWLAGHGDFADRARHPEPALVLLDIKMPGKSGFDVLTWMRANEPWKTTPVLMLTASEQQRDIDEAYRLGANAFLVKPSAITDLVALVEAIRGFWLRFNAYRE